MSLREQVYEVLVAGPPTLQADGFEPVIVHAVNQLNRLAEILRAELAADCLSTARSLVQASSDGSGETAANADWFRRRARVLSSTVAMPKALRITYERVRSFCPPEPDQAALIRACFRAFGFRGPLGNAAH